MAQSAPCGAWEEWEAVLKRHDMSTDDVLGDLLQDVKQACASGLAKVTSDPSYKLPPPMPPGRFGPVAAELEAPRPSDSLFSSVGLLPVGTSRARDSYQAELRVSQGKWMYEVVLGSSGSQQIGWASPDCVLSEDFGVGDYVNSYAYNGFAMKRWHILSHYYGTPWEAGDVIGCAIDLDVGKIEWYHNGQHLGTAFAAINTRSVLYTPTVTAAQGVISGVNFGSIPFMYPIPGYQPLQLGLEGFLMQTRFLVTGMKAACVANENGRLSSQLVSGVFAQIIDSIQQILFAARTVFPSNPGKYPSPLLSFCWGVWIPFLVELMEDTERGLGRERLRSAVSYASAAADESFLDSLWACTMHVLAFQSSISPHFDSTRYPVVLPSHRHAPLLFDGSNLVTKPRPKPRLAYLRKKPAFDMPSSGTAGNKIPVPCVLPVEENYKVPTPVFEPAPSLRLLASLSGMAKIMHTWVTNKALSVDMTLVLTHKDCCPSLRRLLLPSVWWPRAEEGGEVIRDIELLDEEGFQNDRKRLEVKLFGPTDELRYKILQQIETEGGLKNMLDYVDSFIGLINQNDVNKSSVDKSAITRLFFWFCHQLHRVGGMASAPEELFPLGALTSRADYMRIGGLPTHIHRHLSPPSFPNPSNVKRDLFDAIIKLYAKGVSLVFNSIGQLTISATKAVNKFVAHLQTGRVEDNKTVRVLVAEVAEGVRTSTWTTARLMRSSDIELLLNLCSVIIRIFNNYEDSQYYVFIPKAFMELVLDVLLLLYNSHELEKVLQYETQLLPFLITRISDTRIVHVDIREHRWTLIHRILEYESRAVLEALNDDLMIVLVKELFICFQNEVDSFWATAQNVLAHLYHQLAFRSKIPHGATCEHSLHYCNGVRTYISLNSELPASGQDLTRTPNVYEFVKMLFDRLGQFASGFARSLSVLEQSTREASDISELTERRRATMLYDGTKKLLQVLELITATAPQFFHIPKEATNEEETRKMDRKKANMAMLQENIVHILTKYLKPPVRPSPLLNTDGKDPEYVEILAPVAGTVVNLLYGNTASLLPNTPPPDCRINPESPLLQQLRDTSVEWPLDVFVDLANFNWTSTADEHGVQRAKVGYLQRAEVLDAFRQAHKVNQDKRTEHENELNEDNTCPICADRPLNVKLQPCGHTCCRDCITRQQLSRNRCFFCNADIVACESFTPE